MRLSLVCIALVLGGCGIFGRDEPDDPPAELTEIASSIAVNTAWTARVGETDPILRLGLQPASDGSRVFAAAHDGHVAAFDAVTGERAWITDTDRPLSAGPAVGDGLVVLGSNDGDLIAIDASTGEIRWHIQVSSEVLAAPAISRGLVVVQTVDGLLRGLDAADGSEMWLVEKTVPALSLRGSASPVIAGKTVIAGFSNGELVAVDLANGDELWSVLISPARGRTVLERLVDINNSVQVVGKDLYVVNFQGRVAALALESGQVLWTREMSSYRGLSADLANLYITDQASDIVALDRDVGDPLWRQEALRNRRLTAPVPFGSAVVVGDLEGYLHWLSPDTGELIGRARMGQASISGRPLVAGNRLFVLSDAGVLSAFEVEPEPDGG
ncbi:outer membrane protein assembly factor BamB [soil metagenome]